MINTSAVNGAVVQGVAVNADEIVGILRIDVCRTLLRVENAV